MCDVKLTTLRRGGDYPLPIHHEGAAANFLMTTGNILQIGLPEIVRSEELAIRHGPMRAGFVHDGPLILWVFTFGTIILECPFDVRIIPRDQLFLPDISAPNSRLGIQLHLVDTAVTKLMGLRFVTLSPSLSRRFLVAVQEQLCDPRNPLPFEAGYTSLPIGELPKRAAVELCGQ